MATISASCVPHWTGRGWEEGGGGRGCVHQRSRGKGREGRRRGGEKTQDSPHLHLFPRRLWHPTKSTGETILQTFPRYSLSHRFGPEESEPVVDRAGREKRRKKQAIKRMEQILRSHTEEGEEGGGMLTLDREEERRGGERRERRQHKRSILKQGEGRRGEGVKEKGGLLKEKEAKVKFAGSLRKGGRSDRRRVMLRGPAYMLQLPWGYSMQHAGMAQHATHSLQQHTAHSIQQHAAQHGYELQLHPRL